MMIRLVCCASLWSVPAWCAVDAATTEEATGLRRSALVAAVERALPSVVNISTERLVVPTYQENDRQQRFAAMLKLHAPTPPPPESTVRHALGTGVTIHHAGFILTSYHLIQQATRILVTLPNGKTVEADYMAGDENSDVALLHARSESILPPLELEKSGRFYLGETVIAVGNPFGLSHTVTAGVLSSTNREARAGEVVLFRDVLQTDAAINPGGSGGPLLDINGRLIGLVVAANEEGQNIGFAVPVTRIRALLAQWLRPELLENIQFFMNAEETPQGLHITEVHSPAQQKGIQAGDWVVSINGNSICTFFDLYTALISTPPESMVPCVIRRNGEPIRLEVRVHGIPTREGMQYAQEKLGLAFQADDLGHALDTPRAGDGLRVAQVRENSPAAKAGLAPGMVVARINEVSLNTVQDAAEALRSVKTGETVSLEVVRFQETGDKLMATHDQMTVQAQ